jgi:hypothetical protein
LHGEEVDGDPVKVVGDSGEEDISTRKAANDGVAVKPVPV